MSVDLREWDDAMRDVAREYSDRLWVGLNRLLRTKIRRKEQRAARKVRMARKRRRGYA